MTPHDLEPDPQLTAEQRKIVDVLTADQIAEIDNALLANCIKQWRKVAAVVGFTMTDQLMSTFDGVPDIYYAERVRRLVEKGMLDSAGNLNYMRYSEVRLRQQVSE